MAKIVGGVPVAGVICPTDDQDVYAATSEEWHRGGFRSVATPDEMNKITQDRRKEGMLVYVLSEKKTYRYLDGAFSEVQDAVKISVDGTTIIQDEKTGVISVNPDFIPDIPDVDLSGIEGSINEIKEKDKEQDSRLDKLEKNSGGGPVNPIDLADGKTIRVNEANKLEAVKASDKVPGIVQPDNKTIKINNQGLLTTVEMKVLKPDEQSIMFKEDETTIYVPEGDVERKGIVEPDGESTYVEGGKLKSKTTNPDKSTIVYNERKELKVSEQITDSISDHTTRIIALEEALAGGEKPLPSIGLATSTTPGIVRPDNSTIIVNNGVLSANVSVSPATGSSMGIVQPDNKTTTVVNGIISVKDAANKLTDLRDVDTSDLAEGLYLTVAPEGSAKKFKFNKLGEASNHRIEIDVDSSDYKDIYNFTQHYNVALFATVKARGTGESQLNLRYTSPFGDEFSEDIQVYVCRQIPADELDCKLSAKGQGKIIINIFSFV
ncbi:TPA: hypothetical protein SFZ43_000088 [Campylobacter jejuni]|nr:hypothetical protein [Campylobacter jejuni]